MDWSDDVAYSVHVVEDGVIDGRIDLRVLSDPASVQGLVDVGMREFSGLIPDELVRAAERLSRMPVILGVGVYDGSLTSSVALRSPHQRTRRPLRHRRDQRHPRGHRGRTGQPLRR